jgi:hypothetical protein
MENRQKGKRQLIILQLQERIVKMDHEIDKLMKDKELYLRIILEFSQEEFNRSSSEDSSDEELSMEIIPSVMPKPMEEDTKFRRKKKDKKINARQEAFERARAWALERKKDKG